MADQRRKKIVVGMDSSAEAASALRWALRFAAVDDAVVVVHAWETPASVHMAMLPPQIAEFEQAAKEQLEHLLAGVPDDRIFPALRHGRPGAALVAEGSDADVIVVGHRGDGQMSLILGSTANYVLHHARQPVVVVRGDADVPMRRVVVGVDDHDLTDDDGENESVRALRWAYQVPGVEHIQVNHAWSLQPAAYDFFGSVQLYEHDLEAAAFGVVERVVVAAGPPPDGVRLERCVVRGWPSKALLDASEHADLVVVGSRGRGGFRGLLLGSTSSELAAHCDVPVAVVR